MGKDNFKLSEKEKFAIKEGLATERMMSMTDDLDSLIEKEKIRKMNSELENAQSQMIEQNKKLEEAQKDFDFNKIEIKPLYSRLLVKPFEINPFQKLKTEGNIIVAPGGYNLHAEVNPVTGKYEEQEEFIKCGTVVEVGPECKYVKAGDVVYYRKDTVLPIGFLDWGLVAISENQLLACVNEGLEQRFKNAE